jgi:hypothetical protein
MTYSVQAWDDELKCVFYYDVLDAIDYDDAKQVITHQHPDKKVIAVVKKND